MAFLEPKSPPRVTDSILPARGGLPLFPSDPGPAYQRKYWNSYCKKTEILMNTERTTLLASITASTSRNTTTDLGQRYITAPPGRRAIDMPKHILAIYDAYEARMRSSCQNVNMYNRAVLHLRAEQLAVHKQALERTPEGQRVLLELPRTWGLLPRCLSTRCPVCTLEDDQDI